MNDKIFCTEDGFAVKTLYLKSLARDLRGDHLFDYFATFGPLQSLRIHVHPTHSFGFVKFERPEAAATALKMRHHVIDDRKIEVEIADRCHQDEPATNDELRIESTNISGTKFMDLNDDCLRQIFSHVSAMDLCSLHDCSEIIKNNRLKYIANEIFARKYKSIELTEAATTGDEVDRLLTKFGPLVLHIKTDKRIERIKIERIVKWCSGTLRSLDVRHFTFGEEPTRAMEELVSNLRRLIIHNCHFQGGATKLFAHCKSLEHLAVYHEVPHAMLQHTFPRLRIFDCTRSTLCALHTINLGRFISRHRRLETLRLISVIDHSVLLPLIALSCTELRELGICTKRQQRHPRYEISVKSVSRFKKLEKLMICGDQRPITLIRELKHLQLLRELYLMGGSLGPEVVTALTELKMLQVLQIRDCVEFTNFDPLAEMSRLKRLCITTREIVTFDLIHLVSRLTDLETLELDSKIVAFAINKEMHSRIVVARSKSVTTKRALVIVCNGVANQFPI
ncbi:uncharacterized protein LOC119075788 [Bradysia coprophila]|uniref:uncharacterized protein LOC119075788 n=1 Tax=Bradysia coprophila TaxID=38358 RepID=UPI00187DD4AF|nr:uncharacterized protein LOC119075788 [Bradysia coprophila]